MDQRRSVSLWRTDEGWTRLKSRRRESWNGNSSDSDPLRLQLRRRSAGQRNRSRPRVAGGDLVRFFPPTMICHPFRDKRLKCFRTFALHRASKLS